ncbi:MAG: hypothetical protein F7C33_01520 [Desulfurococcales archaeon]|nr:hypothetical protein [Desulfurococcales archaeon]
MTGRLAYAWLAGSILYTVLLWIPVYGLALAPILAAIGIAVFKISPGKAAGIGLLAGLTGYALNLAYTGGLEGLRLVAGIGGGAVALLVVSYHLATPALLAYAAAYSIKNK